MKAALDGVDVGRELPLLAGDAPLGHARVLEGLVAGVRQHRVDADAEVLVLHHVPHDAHPVERLGLEHEPAPDGLVPQEGDREVGVGARQKQRLERGLVLGAHDVLDRRLLRGGVGAVVLLPAHGLPHLREHLHGEGGLGAVRERTTAFQDLGGPVLVPEPLQVLGREVGDDPLPLERVQDGHEVRVCRGLAAAQRHLEHLELVQGVREGGQGVLVRVLPLRGAVLVAVVDHHPLGDVGVGRRGSEVVHGPLERSLRDAGDLHGLLLESFAAWCALQ